jgi:hypothetical protein
MLAALNVTVEVPVPEKVMFAVVGHARPAERQAAGGAVQDS